MQIPNGSVFFLGVFLLLSGCISRLLSAEMRRVAGRGLMGRKRRSPSRGGGTIGGGIGQDSFGSGTGENASFTPIVL